MLKVIYAGTPEFAAVALQALIDSPHALVACWTQPDKPAGRGRKLAVSAVKQLAHTHDIPVYQPATLKTAEAQQTLRAQQADVMVVAAYGLLLPQAVLDIPRLGCLNIHGSLLPRWRGAAPIQRAIQAGDAETGITIMQMDAGLDTGDMLSRYPCEITDEDTAQTLHDKLAKLGARAIVETLDRLEQGGLRAEPQNNALASYAAKISKQEGLIDWQQDATSILRQIRAFNPWPVCFTRLGDKALRIWAATSASMSSDARPGTVVAEGRDGVTVITGDGCLRLLTLQLPGGKALDAEAFINAHSLLGQCLGSAD